MKIYVRPSSKTRSSGRVLMLGWMDEEAFALTKSTGLVHFFSRSRQRLWKKGETSGNVFHVTNLELDCDEDAVLVSVHAEGPACHDGSTSCFTPWLWRKILKREAEAASEAPTFTRNFPGESHSTLARWVKRRWS